MVRREALDEFESRWLPHVTTAGLVRLIELLEQDSPLLIAGSFIAAAAQGCLATHIAWHHPRTAHLDDEDAGVLWLTRVAGLNPATSAMITAWDDGGASDPAFRVALLQVCRCELARRQAVPNASPSPSSTHNPADTPTPLP